MNRTKLVYSKQQHAIIGEQIYSARFCFFSLAHARVGLGFVHR